MQLATFAEPEKDRAVEYAMEQYKQFVGKARPLDGNAALVFTMLIGSILVMGIYGFWGVSGLLDIKIVLYLLLGGTLVVANSRRNQMLRLQSEIVQKQSQEIEGTYAAINAHAMVCLTDPTGIVTSVNDNFLEKFRYRREDIVGTSVSRIYPGGYADPVFNEIGVQIGKGRIWTGENQERASDGSSLYMRCTVVPMLDSAGRHIRTVAIRTDNSEFHRAENARFLKDLFDHLQDEVYIFDVKSLKMVYANLNAVSNSGWTEDYALNKTIIDTDRNMTEKSFRAHVAPLFTGETDMVSLDVARGNGRCEIKTHLYKSETGQPLFVSILRDTTERMKAERAKLESVSIISHELRTPLTSIKGSLRLLNSGILGTFSPKAQSVLDIAVRNTERLLLVVDDILDLEKIRAGKMEMHMAPIDLVDFVSDVVAMNKGYGDELNVQFFFHADMKEAKANISAERMMQVIANILSNAAKYSPTEGTVRISLSEHRNSWRISVSDDGPGIPESGRKSVFESFSQIDSLDGKKRKGTGLGMAISQKIVLAHEGTLDFVSEVGKGTTFFVDLPIIKSVNGD